ncbi:hypothetical protein WJX81_001165 [Elliptochloris bilobata]|uniref:Aromatic amino acid beta-eliminating lyase/threonine aldolase domain-containing protein n=1 Tax=Elliptochloris bilobata TaxID=381761 RepID=A0AAW1R259_9CHLO
MAEAEVGDDVLGDDPTVKALEAAAAARVGKEAALLLPSGTMGNLIAVLAHCSERGAEVIVGDESHTYVYEAGGMSVLGGVAFNVVPTQPNGELSLERLTTAVRPDDMHCARTALVCIENTHNRCGGAVLSLSYMASLSEWAAERGLPIHLDGARVFNAAQALGMDVADVTAHVTSVQFCLSKGLGAPIGSVLAGPAALIARGRRLRKMLGGGMRQAGVIAAPGLLALQQGPQGLAADHAKARKLAAALASIPGVLIDAERVQSNIVVFALAPGPCSPVQLCARLKRRGVLAAPFRGGVRFVTHRDVSAAACEAAATAVAASLTEEGGLEGEAHQANGGAYGQGTTWPGARGGG